MKNTISELAVSEYFLFHAVLGKHLKDDRSLFYRLGEMCFVPEEELSELYGLSNEEEVKDICSEKDFMQFRRVKEYLSMEGEHSGVSSRIEEIINIKGNALSTAKNHRLNAESGDSQNTVYLKIASAANSGMVIAMRILGILQCEGIFVDKNIEAGLSNISKAACWNDVFSLAALLHYCADTREYNLSRLYMAVRDTPYQPLYTQAAKRFGIQSPDTIKEVKLLEKAFNSGVVKRETYEPKYARILYCNALRYRDKEKVIFTESKELLSLIAELPLKLTAVGTRPTDGLLDDMQFVRESEKKKILANIRSAAYRNLNTYRPLCLCSDSEYVLNNYAEALLSTRSRKLHVERFDVADMDDYDFEPTNSNIFIRSAYEDRDNYFILFLYGDVSDRALSSVKSFLQSGKRGKFHINNPCITLDLSGILPICFCDRKNLKQVEQYCDVLQLGDVSPDELAVAIGDILGKKQKLYSLSGITLNGDMYERFADYAIDEVEKIIDTAVRTCGEKGAELALDGSLLAPFIAERFTGKIGFSAGGQTK